jgi:uncharacterized membrane protein HdeD (DUF308 family)
MTNLRRETRWLAGGLLTSGTVTLILAFTALAFPEAALIGGMLAVGLLSVLFGFDQLLTSMALRDRTPGWRLVLGHGILCIVFGLLTVGGTALSFALLLGCVVSWLLCHGALAARMAMSKSLNPRIRNALIASAVFDGVVALLAMALRPLTVFQFLFFGAAYAAVFGTAQILAGVFLRRARLDRTGDSHAHGHSHAVPV